MDDYSSTRSFLSFIIFLGWVGCIAAFVIGFILGASTSALGAIAFMTPLALGSIMLIVFATIGTATIESALNTRRMVELLSRTTSAPAGPSPTTYANLPMQQSSGGLDNLVLGSQRVKVYKGREVEKRTDGYYVDGRWFKDVLAAEAHIDTLPRI